MDRTWTDLAKETIVPTPFRGLRVLLVDHDVPTLLRVALVLETHFYKVTTTELATTALSMLHEGTSQFDLIMADENMPEMDVFAFLKCIKLLGDDMPVILMSHRDDKEMVRKAKEEGVCFFFQKPVSTEQLKNIWQHVKRKRRCLREKAEIQDTEMNSGRQNDSKIIGTNEDGNLKPVSNDVSSKNKQIESDLAGIVKVKFVGESSEAAGGSKRKMEGNTFEENGKRERRGYSFIERNEREMEMENKLRTEERVGSSEKKWRMKWTPDLHHKFIEVISVLGEKACPKRVTEMMNVPRMTNRHVASHLQKYRVQLKQAREALASVTNSLANGNGNGIRNRFVQPQKQHDMTKFPVLEAHYSQNANAAGIWNPLFASPFHNQHSTGHVGHLMNAPHRTEEHQVSNSLSNRSGTEKCTKFLGNPSAKNISIKF